MLRHAVAGILLVAIAALAGPARAAGADAGTVLAFKGDCFVESGGQRNVLKQGDTVRVGDTLDIPEGAKLKLKMADGSVVSAAPGTRFTVAAFQAEAGGGHRDADLSLSSGLLRAVVAVAAQPSRFEVETATGVAAVRSTDWFVEAGTGTMRVGVLEGAVTMKSRATEHEVRIPARWGSRLEAGKDPVPPRIWEQAEFDKVIAATALD
jgi:hypothetical protein